MTRSLLVLALAGALAAPAFAQGPRARFELIGVRKIWDQGKHNAFTDLIRWKDRWYCTFREADAHVGGDGKLRVLESADGKEWKSAALITEAGIDLRDPKLSVTPDGRLMIVAGGSVYQGTKLVGRQPRVTFSQDGVKWTAPQRVLTEGEWLWRVTWHDGTAYGVSYSVSTPVGSPPDWKLELFASKDGTKYDGVCRLDVPGHPNETTLRFLPNGEMLALVRRETGDKHGRLGRSKSPFKEWVWKDVGAQVGGPNFLPLPDGRLVAVVRLYDKKVRTAVCSLDPESGKLTEELALPSGGDTSYAGLVWYDDHLWVSYYSSHEGKAGIYLAEVKVGK